jgi:ABC-type phosphate/phosphonate transport system ATPase subunit
MSDIKKVRQNVNLIFASFLMIIFTKVINNAFFFTLKKYSVGRSLLSDTFVSIVPFVIH